MLKAKYLLTIFMLKLYMFSLSILIMLYSQISFNVRLDMLPAKLTFHSYFNYPYVEGNGFLAYADYVYDDYSNNLEPLDEIRDGDVIFIKADLVRHFFKHIFTNIRSAKIILISHNGDLAINKNYVSYLQDNRITAWFAQNPSFIHPKLIPIPIGLENSNLKPQRNNLFRNNAHNLTPWHKRKILLYVNFNTKSNTKSRQSLLTRFNRFKNKSNNVMIIKSKASIQKYISHLKNAKFVLCPRGNGLDTHRFYESVLMGAIPIVENSTLWPIYKEASVLVLNSFNDLSIKMLYNPISYVTNMKFSKKILFMKTWTNKIDLARKNSNNET